MVLKREQFNLERIATRNFGAKEWLIFIIPILLITDLAILLDIPFLRQAFGFLFLTLLPGLLILQILKLNKIDFLEKFILSWGLSISFIMFFGLLINYLSLSLGYETPLSTIPLLTLFNVAIITLVIIGYKINKNLVDTKGLHLSALLNFTLKKKLLSLNLSASEKAFLIVPILFPALSIFGMRVMNTTDNNIILMFLLFLIPTYVVFVCFFNQKFSKRFYPVVIFSISISLLLLLSLRSNHLIGHDVYSEYYYFRTTLDNLHWCIMGHSTLDACLAISLLPAIYQSILNIPTEFLYKTIPSVLCSVFPLVIYVISKKYVEEGYAFLASMIFMSNHSFLWTEYNARAIIAMLFFAFAMMTLFNDRIEPLKKRMLFIVFMASCMVSHYSSTYAFFFVMLATFVGMELLSKKYTFKKVVSLTTVILFFAFIFFWYSQVTEAAFNSGVNFVEKMFNNLFDFAVIEAKSETAQTLLGEGIMQKNIVTKIHWVLTWITFAFIGIGVATLIRKYKEMSFPELNFKKPDFLKDKFEVVYFVIVLACSGLLVAILTIPHISKGYGLGRAYPLANTILSVFFVIGGIILAKNLSFIKQTFKKSLTKNLSFKPFLGKKSFTKRSHYQRNNGKKDPQVRAYLIILLVLVPYFLCVTGAMYNIFGVPNSIVLNSEGEQYDMYYIHDHQLIAGEWQSSSNVVEGKLVNKQKTIYNMTEYLGMSDEKNWIYDNGGSEVWK